MIEEHEPTLYEKHQESMIDRLSADPAPYTQGLLTRERELEKYRAEWDYHLSRILEGDFAKMVDFKVIVHRYRPADWPPYEVRLFLHSVPFPPRIYKMMIEDLKLHGHELDANIEIPLDAKAENPVVPCAS